MGANISSSDDKADDADGLGGKPFPPLNPLANPTSRWKEVFQRVKLFQWWVRYNVGIAEEAILKDKIIELGISMGLQDRWLKRIVRHAVSEFSKKGLGADYYGYHNIIHELEATYFTMLAARGQKDQHRFTDEDLKYLFMAALFHDFDPMKQFDKPNEDSVEWFIRNDARIRRFIDDVGVNLDLVMALIHRTAYPYKGEIKDHASRRMNEMFTRGGIPEHDIATRKRYEDLGWFLSVSERMAGYALNDFSRSKELARRNAHALGWHPSLINEESVKYFTVFKEEKEMVELVLEGIPEQNKKMFWDNVEAFREAWDEELGVRRAIDRNEVKLEIAIEEAGPDLDSRVKESVLNLYRELPVPIRVDEEKFRRSLSTSDTILITLRINDKLGKIVGYAKGGSLENYSMRRGTHDENMGKKNTAYLESISIRPGYWGGTGGHLLRLKFLAEAKRRGYRYVTAYVHRNVITHRMNNGESIEIVQKYDPDRLDYYRQDLSKFVEESLRSTVTADIPESKHE